MVDQSSSHTSCSSVSVACVLPSTPTRAIAFQHAMTAVLHASFSFGRERPAQLVYSYDPLGEEYADPVLIPAGSIASLADAVECLSQSAPFYNQSIGLNFAVASTNIAATGRVYDEPGALVISLDFEQASWRQLIGARRSSRSATVALIDAGRVLFTLLPLTYLLIGPSEALADLPAVPNARLLHTVPIAMFSSDLHHRKRKYLTSALHVEQLPRGALAVQRWNASCTLPERSTAQRVHPSRMRKKT